MSAKNNLKVLKERWESACDSYLKALCEMWNWSPTYGYWIDGVGSLYSYGDWIVISIEDIIYCVENDITEEELREFSEYNVDACELGFDNINLRSWHKGCPRLSKEAIERIRGLKGELEKEVERMKEELKNEKSVNY